MAQVISNFHLEYNHQKSRVPVIYVIQMQIQIMYHQMKSRRRFHSLIDLIWRPSSTTSAIFKMSTADMVTPTTKEAVESTQAMITIQTLP